MRGIFISYRRDDAAGHAGRLFDGLKERFGAERVFMDVSDLRPGEDFVAALDRALAEADVVLAVIGPRWLDAADASGRRRLDDPDDFVRRELTAALASDGHVIPVLVHGARMPAAESLPAPLRALARRQAIALTDTRWESDVRDLVACLDRDDRGAPQKDDRRARDGERKPGARPTPDDGGGSRIGRGALVLFALGVLVAIAGAWMLFRPQAGTAVVGPAPGATGTTEARRADGRAPPPSRMEATSRDDATRGAPSEAKPGSALSLAVPEGSTAKFRTNRAALVFELLALRLEPRDAQTRTLVAWVRMLNDGPLDEYLGSEQFRLVVGDATSPPENTVTTAVDGVAAKEAAFRFVVPASARSATLLVRVGDDESRVPLALDAATTPLVAGPGRDEFGRPLPPRVVETVRPLPATIPAGQRVRMGKPGVAPVEYTLVDATLDRETSERASLTLTVRCAVPKDGMGINFWSSSVRLWVDGVPVAPRDLVNETVYPGESKEAKFVFDLVAMPSTLEVGFVKAGERTRVPLDLSALPRSATAARAK